MCLMDVSGMVVVNDPNEAVTLTSVTKQLNPKKSKNNCQKIRKPKPDHLNVKAVAEVKD